MHNVGAIPAGVFVLLLTTSNQYSRRIVRPVFGKIDNLREPRIGIVSDNIPFRELRMTSAQLFEVVVKDASSDLHEVPLCRLCSI
jgi:hypothetical protein